MRHKKTQSSQKVAHRAQTLQQGDNQYRDLFEKSADAILIIENGRFVDCNQAAVEMLRYNNKEGLLNTHPSELSPEKQPDGRLSYEKADDIMKAALEQGSKRFEWHHKRADNTVFPVEVLLTALSVDEDNQILYTVWRDITERKLAEEALRASNKELLKAKRRAEENEEKFRAFTNQATEGITVADMEGNYIFVNPAFCNMSGYTREELLSMTVFDMKARDQDPSSFYESKGTLEGVPILVKLQRKDKTPYLTEIVGKVITINNEKYVLGTIRDITNRKKAEDALKKSNRALKMLSECNQTLVRCQDEEQLLKNICENIVLYGGYALAWIGFAEQNEKKSVRPVAQAGFEDGYLESIEISWGGDKYGYGPTGKAIRSGKPEIMHDIIKDSSYEPWRQEAIKRGFASSIAIPLVDKGQVLGTLNIYDTETNTFDENEVNLLNELANNIVFGIRAIRMQNERLQALVEAQHANSVKTLFLANMSHEIRTPLNSILGFSELLAETFSDETGEMEKSFIDTIQKSGQRLLRTVHGVLDMSILESNTFDLSKEKLDLKYIVRQVINEQQKKADEKELEIRFTSKINNPVVFADEYSLAQALCNIVENAIKYTEKGVIHIWLEKKDGNIQLVVNDTGIGISREFQKRMYEAFSQESEGYAKRYQGLGLGLALTKRYLKLNNVEMAVKSKKGVGTTITLTFPVKEEAGEE